MGKEAKIGLAVILILLIIFGVVLARRLCGPSGTSLASSSGGNDRAASKAGNEPVANDAEVQTPAEGAAGPTVLAAEALPSKTTERSPVDVSQWDLASDSSSTQQSASSAGAKAPTRSYWPNPPVPDETDPYRNRYQTTQQSAPAAQAWQDSGTSQASDPFQNPTLQMPTAEGTADQTASALRVLQAPPRRAEEPGTGGYRSADAGGYSSDNAVAQQTPTYQQSSRRSYPSLSQPSNPVRQLTVSDGGSNIPSKYGTDNFQREGGEYEVQPNDSYWIISEKLYGTGAYFKALAEHNRDQVPREEQLQVGQLISAPGVTELEETYPGLCPKPSRRETVRSRASFTTTRSPYVGGRTYVVEEGDTLFDIARYELGKASRWVEIYELNRDLLGDDFDYLTSGMELVLPDSEPADTVTRRPQIGPSFRR